MIDVTTADHHGHWDVEDIKQLCEYRDQLRGTLSLAEEGLANYAQEIQRLQKALNFWLPGISSEELPPDLQQRLEDDIYKLAGYQGPMEDTAENRGWITLNAEPHSDKQA